MNQTTTQHTPGPWKVEGTSRVGEARITAPFKPTCNYLVALASPDAPDDATRDANARLIAAAPELLEACIEAMDVLDDCEANGMGKSPTAAILASVIAKATKGGGEK